MAYNYVSLIKTKAFESVTLPMEEDLAFLAIQNKTGMAIALRTFVIPKALQNISNESQDAVNTAKFAEIISVLARKTRNDDPDGVIGFICFQKEMNQVFPKFKLGKEFDDYMRDNFRNPVVLLEGKIELQRGSSLLGSKSFNKSFNIQELDSASLTAPFPLEIVQPIEGCKWVLNSFSLSIGWEDEMWLGSNLKPRADDLLHNLFQENTQPKDFILVAGNGTEISCHGFILGAQSPALAAMVNPNGMKESVSKRIEMKMFSEETLTAFVRYIYRQLVPLKKIDCDTALELFRLGHLYQLAELTTNVSKLLLQKGEEWFSPNSVLELYFLLKTMNQEEFKELTDHTVAVMLKLSEAVRQCERFKELGWQESNELLWILLNKSISELALFQQK